MKVLEFFGFDHLPTTGGSGITNLATVIGTKLQYRTDWSSAYNNVQIAKIVDPGGGGAWVRTLANTLSATRVVYRGLLFFQFDEIQAGLKSETSKLTMGVRQNMQSWTNQSLFTGTLVVIHEDDSHTQLNDLTDWSSLAPNTVHYWEVAFDRVTKTVRVYRDHTFIRTIDLTARIASSGNVKGFGFGVTCTNTDFLSGTGSMSLWNRDVYFAQVEDGDATDRLGAQLVKRLPVAAVNAAWTSNISGQSQLDALNLPAASLTVVPTAANMTSLAVNESDPNGLITFSTDALAPSDRITAINMQVDAVATPGNDGLDTLVLNGDATESTKKLTFTQAFIINTRPALSNYGKSVFLRQWKGTAGNKSELANYKLKLKASS